MRKKLLLAGVAALLMATSAHADATLSPTDPLIGSWCDVKGSLYKRGPLCMFTIERDGYVGEDYSCTFLEIKRIRNGVESFSECSSDALEYTYEKETFQIFGNRLKWQTITRHTVRVERLTASGATEREVCISVQGAPAGYLNLRQGPGMNFKVKAKLTSLQHIKADVKTDEWTHITSVPGIDKNLRGWVYSKYVSGESEGECRTPH
jgi:hypothetical protein